MKALGYGRVAWYRFDRHCGRIGIANLSSVASLSKEWGFDPAVDARVEDI